MAGLSSQVLHIWDVDEQICEIFGIWAVIRCWFMVTIVAIIQRWPQIWIQFSRIWWSNETGGTCQWFHVISCPNICVYIYRVVYRIYICICTAVYVCLISYGFSERGLYTTISKIMTIHGNWGYSTILDLRCLSQDWLFHM